MSVEGIENENNIGDYLDGKMFSQMNPNMQKFIIFLNSGTEPRPDLIIRCRKINRKADIEIDINGNFSNVSIKNDGSGHSVHQEKVDFFINEFMVSNGAEQNEIAQVRNFIDSLKDGQEILGENTEMKDVIQNFLDTNQRSLLERFLSQGRYQNGFAGSVYFGTVKLGLWMTISDIIDKMIADPIQRQNNVLYVGNLTFQAWNRTNEEKRHVVQAKFGSMRQFLEN